MVGLVSGIEMEIVNSCEANNGGCSHGCSHSSAGPLCSCPRGYELDEDQKTCVGASWLPPDAHRPRPGARPPRLGPDAAMRRSLLSHPVLSLPQAGGQGGRPEGALMRGSTVTPLSPRSTGPMSDPLQLSSVTWFNSLCWRNRRSL